MKKIRDIILIDDGLGYNVSKMKMLLSERFKLLHMNCPANFQGLYLIKNL